MEFTLTLSEESAMRLDILKDMTDADDYAEVVANALRLYEAMIEQSTAGRRWIVKNEDGSLQPFNPWQ